jgi:protoporphyrinogen oxidase
MASKSKHTKKIAIIGAGISGLASAYFLADKGYSITIFEREQGSGGLAGSAEVHGTPIEKFYHHFFSSDTELLHLAQEIGVGDQIQFYNSSVGMYVGGRLYPFTTPFDLLKFTPLPFIDRVKMGLLAAYLVKRKDWQGLERWTVKELFDWLRAPKLYEIVWKPLLEMKFGDLADTVPATFLWGRINPRGRSRRGTGEQLGYFNHGYHTFFTALEKAVLSKGVQIRYESVETITSTKNGVMVRTDKKKYQCDDLIFTGSNVLLTKLYTNISPKQVEKLKRIQYQAINCMILELKRSVSPFYWLNALDKDISFIGCIEHTNLVPKEMYGGHHVMYVFNYLRADDPIYTMDPKAVYDLYTNDLHKLFPHFKKSDVISWQLARNPFATPIYNGKYSHKMPPNKIAPHIFLANTSQVYPEDRNVNNGIALARKVVALC